MMSKATRAAVQAAYDELVAQGIPPTYDAVRERIGGGSMTTIARHLRDICAEPASPATTSLPPTALPSDEAPVELPLELREAMDGLSRIVATVLTGTIAAERERAAQLRDMEAAARTAAVAAARAETEALRRELLEGQGRAVAEFDVAADEVKALQEVITTLLEAVGLEASDDPDDLREAAGDAVSRIRALTDAAARVSDLEADAKRWEADATATRARVEELRNAADRAEHRLTELSETASRVPVLEARIAELSSQATAGAETIGRAKALEEVVARMTEQLARAAAPPAPDRPPARPRPAKPAAGATPRATKDGDVLAAVPEANPADQPLPFPGLVPAVPAPSDIGPAMPLEPPAAAG